MPILLDLGLLDLSSTFGLCLSSSSTVTLSTPPGTSFCSRGSLEIVELLKSRSAWVRRGNGFQLVLSLTLDGESLEQGLLETIAHVLLKADLWGQLQLDPSLSFEAPPRIASSRGRQSYISLKLSHSLVSPSNLSSAHHRLAPGLIPADTKPPSGVAVFTLDDVFLSIHLTRLSLLSSKERQKRSHLKSDENLNEEMLLFDETSAISKLRHRGSMGPLGSEMLLENDRLLDDQPSFMFMAGKPNHRSQTFGLPATHKENPPPSTVGDTVNLKDRSALLQPIVDLIDASLRLIISEKPRAISSEVIIVQTELAFRLAEIAPALWSPSYLSAVSQRAVFLPTISHALSQSLYRNAVSDTLKSKLKKLGEIAPEPSDVESPCAKEESGQLYNAISTRLWHLLQRQLYDGKAARGLRRVIVPADAPERTDEGKEILEDQTERSLETDIGETPGAQHAGNEAAGNFDCGSSDSVMQEDLLLAALPETSEVGKLDQSQSPEQICSMSDGLQEGFQRPVSECQWGLACEEISDQDLSMEVDLAVDHEPCLEMGGPQADHHPCNRPSNYALLEPSTSLSGLEPWPTHSINDEVLLEGRDSKLTVQDLPCGYDLIRDF